MSVFVRHLPIVRMLACARLSILPSARENISLISIVHENDPCDDGIFLIFTNYDGRKIEQSASLRRCEIEPFGDKSKAIEQPHRRMRCDQ